MYSNTQMVLVFLKVVCENLMTFCTHTVTKTLTSHGAYKKKRKKISMYKKEKSRHVSNYLQKAEYIYLFNHLKARFMIPCIGLKLFHSWWNVFKMAWHYFTCWYFTKNSIWWIFMIIHNFFVESFSSTFGTQWIVS